MIIPNDYTEGAITYAFSQHCSIFRPQNSAFYTRHWQHFGTEVDGRGNAEVDFVIFDPREKHLWLLETKDYRSHRRTKPSEIGREFARKCRDTLSLLAGLQVSSQVASDSDVAWKLFFSKTRAIHCILHVEQSRSRRSEYSVISPQNLKDTVKRNLRALDPRAQAGDAAQLVKRTIPCTITP